jgi:hypothetical protein
VFAAFDSDEFGLGEQLVQVLVLILAFHFGVTPRFWLGIIFGLGKGLLEILFIYDQGCQVHHFLAATHCTLLTKAALFPIQAWWSTNHTYK